MKTKRKKKVIIYIILAVLLLFVIAVVYYFQFTAYGFRTSVPYRHSFEEIEHNVYINSNNAMNTDEVVELINKAKERDKQFFGELQFEENTIIIICDDDKLISKLGGDHDTYTLVFPSKKNYISVSDEYFNIDILSHEITHAELHSRLSIKALNKVPTWFDEGVALQNDYREQYSLEAWIEQTENGKNTVALEDMDKSSEFYAGTVEDRRFRYLNAKHEVSGWMDAHKQQGLLELIDELNSGNDFNTAYGI